MLGEGSLYSINRDITNSTYVTGVPEKMSLSEKGSLFTKGHFFWDTMCIIIGNCLIDTLIYNYPYE